MLVPVGDIAGYEAHFGNMFRCFGEIQDLVVAERIAKAGWPDSLITHIFLQEAKRLIEGDSANPHFRL